MARYSPERKEAILKKMAPPHNMNVAELASQEGISTATLYNWRKAARVRGAVLPSNIRNLSLPDSVTLNPEKAVNC